VASVQIVILSPPMPGIIPQAESSGASEIAPSPIAVVLNSDLLVIPRRVNVVPFLVVGIENLRVFPRYVTKPPRTPLRAAE
jgi:hypothetical protein